MQTIADGVHHISIGANAFLVDGDQGVTLIDAGMPGKLDAITTALREIGRSPDDLTAILVTHAHFDHTGSAAAVKDASGASLAMSPTDARVARGRDPVTPPPIATRLGPLAWFMRFIPEADHVEVDHEVSEADQANLPDDFTVLDTPGHTPGHVSFLLDRAGGVMFVGDAAMSSRKGGIVRGIMNVQDPTLDASIAHIATHDFTAAVFGHSAPMTSGAATAFRRFAATLV
ncbi:MAG TPA: MBL fold metallo-hydrolase [Nitriliruptoraceae bacterium]|nr:MBL fold metallo-hydrolase [Nitriliruptoraceae bacterium]